LGHIEKYDLQPIAVDNSIDMCFSLYFQGYLVQRVNMSAKEIDMRRRSNELNTCMQVTGTNGTVYSNPFNIEDSNFTDICTHRKWLFQGTVLYQISKVRG
jgi:hypothetical protein